MNRDNFTVPFLKKVRIKPDFFFAYKKAELFLFVFKYFKKQSFNQKSIHHNAAIQ